MRTLNIVLHDNGDAPHMGKALKVPHHCLLKFTLPVGSLVCTKTPVLHTNYPVTGRPFDRQTFYELKSPYDGESDWAVEIKFDISGCFEYYLAFTEPEGKQKHSLVGYLYADPAVTLNGKPLPIDGITLQTVMPKSLGVFEDWEKHIRLASKLGYNMIHYTPVQELGQSQSCYSLYDQLKLNTNLFKSNEKEEVKWGKLKEFFESMEIRHHILAMTDVVWNHTADNSPWLVDHPEAGYNLQNSPHLKSAYELDDAVVRFSNTLLDEKGYGPSITDEGALAYWVDRMVKAVFPTARLWEYYVINVAQQVEEFRKAVAEQESFDAQYGDGPISHDRARFVFERDGLHRLASGERNSLRVHLSFALAAFNVPKIANPSPDAVNSRCAAYEQFLNVYNVDLYEKYNTDVEVAIRNMTERVRYERVAAHGPRLGPLTAKRPLVDSYFTRIGTCNPIDPHDPNPVWPIALANNGWIYNDNPLLDFAAPNNTRNSYFRREVIVWGDCVKLRYGKKPEDNPWLWEHMKNYTELMASVFHAFRIDNCHSTPLHVGQYLLDAARRVRPEIYVICELFTGSEEIDAVFVSKLGIAALIREAMGASDPWELGRLCHRYGGSPVGSFDSLDTTEHARPGLPGALFAECTHDNETPAQKRDPHDTLSNAALVAATDCSIGSVRGYDELIPKTLDVVKETRLYSAYNGDEYQQAGIQRAKEHLNKLHQQLAADGFTQTHVHQSHNTIAIQRHNPATHEAVYIVAHAAFGKDGGDYYGQTVRVPGEISEMLFAGRLEMTGEMPNDLQYITGLGSILHFREGDEVLANPDDKLHIEVIQESNDVYHVQLPNFPPGSILSFRVDLPDTANEALARLNELLSPEGVAKLDTYFAQTNLVDMNTLLYHCDTEERQIPPGGGVYVLDGKPFPYCGLQGFANMLEIISKHNDLGHHLCDNLRVGNWMMSYIVERLTQAPRLQQIQSWLRDSFACARALPRYLIPKYFYLIVMTAYKHAVRYTLSKMSSFIREGDSFVHSLALASVQVYGMQPSAPLLTDDELLYHVGADDESKASLAAGLPHFTTGYMRTWGRDTFISLRGLFLVTGRYEIAKKHILAFAVTVRHGLIPNLLDGGSRPRYNSRDSVWWFLQCIQDYCNMVPNGIRILDETITRLFANDCRERAKCTLGDIIQEIMTRHANNIEFREWDAGRSIDDRMQDQGFNISIKRDPKTGFLFGGNIFNCGTWMDKMGESDRAGNRGIPATPRDGAPIEITGLLKSTLRWLASLHSQGQYPHHGVALKDGSTLSYAEWSSVVQTSFEREYYVPQTPEEDSQYNIMPQLVARRGIYKDVVGAYSAWTEYQLRPNICVAMVVAPELFVHAHAQKALEVIEEVLLTTPEVYQPMGMKTLDPADWNYCGDYGHDPNSTDRKTAGGFNYHQGPEWVWPIGYFLRAKILFSGAEKNSFNSRSPNGTFSSSSPTSPTSPTSPQKSTTAPTTPKLVNSLRISQPMFPPSFLPTPPHPPTSTTTPTTLSSSQSTSFSSKHGVPPLATLTTPAAIAHAVNRHLRPHRYNIIHSPFRGLPELTNTNGTPCHASCDTQAWSIATVLDALYDVHKMKENNY